MDGVTDAPYRLITARYGKPAVTYTEFTSVEGIRAGAERLLHDFLFADEERPVIAQMFGGDPEPFFAAAVIACELGFDGIDINMGCPSKNVTQKGAGAALILDPPRARAILQRTKDGIRAWTNGIGLEDAGVAPNLIPAIKNQSRRTGSERLAIPVSLKTRIGYDAPVTREWISELLPAEPAAIAVHGRTLKQLYRGEADWEQIALAKQTAANSATLVLGNGDISSLADARERCTRYGLDGALIGRAADGNPWIFQDYVPSFSERCSVAREHAQLHANLLPPQSFLRMRKHLIDYFKGFDGAKNLRTSLLRATTLEEVEGLLNPYTN